MRRFRIDAAAYDEAVDDARKYHAQAKRLHAALKRTEDEMAEELFRLQQDLSWALSLNAQLACENAELNFQLQTRGDA